MQSMPRASAGTCNRWCGVRPTPLHPPAQASATAQGFCPPAGRGNLRAAAGERPIRSMAPTDAVTTQTDSLAHVGSARLRVILREATRGLVVTGRLTRWLRGRPATTESTAALWAKALLDAVLFFGIFMA